MLIFDGRGLFKSLVRAIQHPIKGFTKQTADFDRSKVEVKSPLKSNLIGVARQAKLIRKREFDKLRALRLHMVTAGEGRRQQFFHTTIHSRIENRASTIKKIDEIEAQMSMQWWKTDRLDLDKDKQF